MTAPTSSSLPAPPESHVRSSAGSGWILWALWFVTSGVMALAYARHGYNGLDDGFIQGLSWRLIQGQRPYVDFLYIRPPGSVLLHALPMLLVPPGYQVIFERVAFFFTIGGYSFLSTVILTRVTRLPGTAWVPGLALLSFVAAVQNFPPMPWHTVDGILFAALSAYGVCCVAGIRGLLIGGLFAVLAASCKQSFFPVPVVVLIHVGWTRGPRNLLRIGLVMGGMVLGIAALMGFMGLLPEAVQQWTAETRTSSLLHAGFVSYVRAAAFVLAPLVLLGGMVETLRRVTGGRLPAVTLPFVAVAAVFGVDILQALQREQFTTPAFNYPGALFLLACCAAVLPSKGMRGEEAEAGRFPHLDRRGRAALLLLLAVAWCASVSWGYPTPVLFSAPIWFGVAVLIATRLGVAPQTWVPLALVLAIVAQAVGYRHPYREAPRAEMTHELGAVVPRLHHVLSDSVNQSRLLELADLAERYPSFTVLPALPGAHYLIGATPPIPVDWARNSESAGRVDWLIDELEGSGAVVLLERSAEPVCESGPACSGVAAHVVEHWEEVDAGRHFRVLRRAGP